MTSGRLDVLVKALLVCGAVVAIDQLTKGIVREQITRGDAEEVLPFLKISNTRNSGVAFGFASGISPLLIACAIAFLVGLLAFLSLRDNASTLAWLPAGLLVGGALANLSDRVRDGAVTDYIDLPAWPTFNLADVCIVVGVVLLVLLSERQRE